MRLLTTRRFERDLRRSKKRGKNLDKLWTVVDLLLQEQPLDPRHRVHRLSGGWSGSWDCHIEADWLQARISHHGHGLRHVQAFDPQGADRKA